MNISRIIRYSVYFLAMLGFLSYIISIISPNDKIILLIAAYSFVMGVALIIGLDFKSIGLSKASYKNGIKLALPFMLLIVTGALLVYFINPELFKDSRYQLSTQSMLFSIFFVLPIYTVLFEEIAFRGVLFSMLRRVTSKLNAVLISSLSFGLWHVFTAKAININTLFQGFTFSKTMVVFAVILATSVAGAFFTWLRIKSDSLLAPILVHWAINATGIILAYFAWRV